MSGPETSKFNEPEEAEINHETEESSEHGKKRLGKPGELRPLTKEEEGRLAAALQRGILKKKEEKK